MKKSLCVMLLIMMAIGTIGAQPNAEQAPEQTEILVSTAASLTDCMNKLKDTYMQDHPEVIVTANYGSSGSLQQQIEQGAPADIFFSAGIKQMKALQDKALMDDTTVRQILENKIVLIVPTTGEKLSSFDDLKKDSVEKIGIGDPKSVPAGQYAAEALTNMGLNDILSDKFVYGHDVREVLSWVETANVQAGLVYETDAKVSDNVTICCTAPEGSHKKVIYPIGIVKSSTHRVVAEAFMDYLFGDQAADIFKEFGFTVI